MVWKSIEFCILEYSTDPVTGLSHFAKNSFNSFILFYCFCRFIDLVFSLFLIILQKQNNELNQHFHKIDIRLVQ